MIQCSSGGGKDGGGCGLLSVLLLGMVGWVLFICPHCSCLTACPFGNRFCTTLLPYYCTGTCTIRTGQERQQGRRRAYRYSSTDTQNSTRAGTIPYRGSHSTTSASPTLVARGQVLFR